MKYLLDGIEYDVIIEKKNNKNLYIRVKDDGKIHITCSYFTSKLSIKKILDSNQKTLRKITNETK